MNLKELKMKLWESGLPYEDEAINKLDLIMNITLETNEKFNLTAITNKEDFVEKMIFDSALGVRDIDLQNKKILDFGSGAGFPGLVIATLFPSAHVYLLDATKKKTDYLLEVAKKVNLQNVEVINARGEEYANMHREEFDFVIARAVAPLSVLLEICVPLVKVGGEFIAMKGKTGIEEYENASMAIKKLGIELKNAMEEELPNSKETRFNLVFVKKTPTIKKYPRMYKEIIDKPL